MKIRCHNCQKVVEVDSKQESLINTAITNEQELVFIECPECYKDIPINSTDLLSINPQKDADKKNKNIETIKCPVCQEGIVSYIDDGEEKFWGCGECGNVWFSQEELNKDL